MEPGYSSPRWSKVCAFKNVKFETARLKVQMNLLKKTNSDHPHWNPPRKKRLKNELFLTGEVALVKLIWEVFLLTPV